ncbi:MAG: HlyC/CorC family transporter [Desulfosarcina sp.]|nr:HlyC/CorC family transporter [Desulfosarcina sp.]MBC2768238.1 HlyC/CorC family transporter [Desulfosarcina sp.]
MIVNQFFLLFILLLLSGFFSSAETALFSISHTRARHMAKENIRSHLLIKRMKDDPHKLLTTILIGNNVVNVAASAIATSLAISMFANYAVGLSTGVMTFLILVFGEVIPKSFATRNNILIARTGKMSKTPSATEEELITFVEVVEEQGEIKEEEREMIHNVFELDDTSASEIMTPRTDMFVVDADAPLDLKAMAESGFTRIPVIEGDIDHVVGIINIKDIFMHQATSDTPVNVRAIMRPPYFVPENKKLDRMLNQFKARKNHMAVIVDEYGGVSGLITLEDALEELVGEIRDETDKEEPHIISKKPREWMVLGKSDIEEVNEKIGMHIPESSDYDTFSGFILDRIGRIPEEDEAFTIDGHKVMVMEMDGNRIRRYLVQALSSQADG